MEYLKEITSVINEGLFVNNLDRIVALCKEEVQDSDHPLIPFTLMSVFVALRDSLDSQAIPHDQYVETNNAFSEKLSQRILSLPSEAPEALIDDLNSLIMSSLSLIAGKKPSH